MINKIKYVVILFMACSLPLEAQQWDCSGDRYLEQVFTGVEVVRDLPYGEAVRMSGNSQVLLLDVFTPAGDNLKERPLVIMAHGGAFLSGDRSQTEAFCLDFARRGYVCANIEYRLLDRLVADSTGITEAAFMAINDLRAAVRYFREDVSNSNTFGISSDHIFAAGVSAGAIMASHVGFLDKQDQVPEYIQAIINKHGGFEGNSSENTQYSSEVDGVLNYSGALTRSHWIDEDDVPVYSAHDDQDPVVPCIYSTSNILPFPLYMYGSCAMKTVADQMNITNQLYLVLNSTGHVSYFDIDSVKSKVLDESAAFLKSIICNGSTRASELNAMNPLEISIYPNPFRNILYIQSDELVQEITLTDLTGKNYLKIESFVGNSLELGDLPRGVYLVRIRTNQGVSVMKAVKE